MSEDRLPFEYEVDESGPKVTAWGGLPVLAEAMDKWGVSDALRAEVKLGGRRKFDSADLVKTLVLTLAAGGDCVDDVGVLRNDRALQLMLNAEIPAPETVRQALDTFHEQRLVDEAEKQALAAGEKAFVPEESERLKGLRAARKKTLEEMQRRFPQRAATLDIDATVEESHKRAAKPHYLNGLGYQPVVAVWAEQDLVVDDEFRDGNVPAHFGALSLAQRAFQVLPLGIEERLLRADTQMYDVRALQWLAQENIGFAVGVIKRDGFNEACRALPKEKWQLLETRSDSQLHVAELEYRPERMRVVAGLRYIAIRISPLQGDLLDDGHAAKYLGVATNRDGAARDIVTWYWAKAGTVEHVHDVMKNELGAGVLPSGRFGANAAWYRISTLTYNLLSILRRIGPEELRNARPKRLRLHVFALPSILTRHARQLIARVSRWLIPTVHAVGLRHAV